MSSITRPSEYAIRALTYLALQPPGSFHLARKIAEDLQIPATFLTKCLQPLVARGILGSQRGRHGGFRLLLTPPEISLYQVIDAIEHLERPRTCFLGQAECTDERACPMHAFWKAASESFLTHLRTSSIEDLARFGQRNPQCSYPAPTSVGGTS